MCVGPFARMCHWGPLVALGIIKWISLATVYCNTMWWPPESGLGALSNMLSFLALATLTTFHFFCAMFEGPGYLERGWKPVTNGDEKYLQFCQMCRGYKAPRSHHCRKCGRCVMKMDHHCPWINNCVGHFNHGHFVGFLFFSVVACAQASFILIMTLYHGLNRSPYERYSAMTRREPLVILSLWSLLCIMFALGLAIGVVIAVGALLFFQFKAIWKNQTCIEDWILEKAHHRRRGTDKIFLHPYSLGRWRNLDQVLTPGCFAKGDGINWPLRDGSEIYSLTIEQLEQKAEKRSRTREYRIVREYSGSWFPVLSHGLKVTFGLPCSDEPRIVVSMGDVIKVTRWKKHWLYGNKVHKLVSKAGGDTALLDKMDSVSRVRGWFPRNCAAEAFDSSIEDDDLNFKTPSIDDDDNKQERRTETKKLK